MKTLLTKNVSVQDSSASAALQTFTSGKGDVLLDYESDAIAAEKAGDAIQYIIPKQTILIETPIAITAKTLARRSRRRRSSTGSGARPARRSGPSRATGPCSRRSRRQFASKFPTPPQLFTISLPGRLDEGQEGVLRSVQRLGHEDRAGRRECPLPPASASPLSHAPAHPHTARARPQAGARACAPRRPRARAVDALHERDRADPAGGDRRQGVLGGRRRLLGLDHHQRGADLARRSRSCSR